MSQFGRSRLTALCIQTAMTGFYSRRVSPFGILRVKAFFRLTEDYRRLHVLHRLLMPRHPPAALNSLTNEILFKLKWATIAAKGNKLPFAASLHLSFIFEKMKLRYAIFFCVMWRIPQASLFISEFIFTQINLGYTAHLSLNNKAPLLDSFLFYSL